MKHVVPIIALVSSLSLLAACHQADSNRSEDSTTAGNSTSQAANPTEPIEVDMQSTMPETLTLEQAVVAAKKEMADRMSLSADDIELVTSQAVTWGDGSMGCPEPGMMYTQALVPGYYIQLRHNGVDAHYHASRTGQPMHCPTDRSQPPLDAGKTDQGSRNE